MEEDRDNSYVQALMHRDKATTQRLGHLVGMRRILGLLHDGHA